MIEKFDDITAIRRQASSGNISLPRLELYLALEGRVPGGLTLLRNCEGYFVLIRAGRGYAGNAATMVEHFYVYREAGANPAERVPDAAVRDVIDFITASHENVWLAFDNLAPNGHKLDTSELAYNLLPIAGSSYEAYIKGLGSDRRRALDKALCATENAHEEITTDRDAIRAVVASLIREHALARYGTDSFLEQEANRAEIDVAIDVFPTEMRILRDRDRYAFLVSNEIDRSLYVPLVGGTDPFMIKRIYHSLIKSAFACGDRIAQVDAASASPYLKRQMGFAPVSFHAVLQGDPEWTHYIM
jgi:hypothetical protein